FSYSMHSATFHLFFLALLFFFFNATPTTEIYTLSYTTLFRSPDAARIVRGFRLLQRAAVHRDRARLIAARRGEASVQPPQRRQRSEEHTSELQSRGHLVCRLLLEKKKKMKSIIFN